MQRVLLFKFLNVKIFKHWFQILTFVTPFGTNKAWLEPTAHQPVMMNLAMFFTIFFLSLPPHPSLPTLLKTQQIFGPNWTQKPHLYSGCIWGNILIGANGPDPKIQLLPISRPGLKKHSLKTKKGAQPLLQQRQASRLNSSSAPLAEHQQLGAEKVRALPAVALCLFRVTGDSVNRQNFGWQGRHHLHDHQTCPERLLCRTLCWQHVRQRMHTLPPRNCIPRGACFPSQQLRQTPRHYTPKKLN